MNNKNIPIVGVVGIIILFVFLILVSITVVKQAYEEFELNKELNKECKDLGYVGYEGNFKLNYRVIKEKIICYNWELQNNGIEEKKYYGVMLNITLNNNK